MDYFHQTHTTNTKGFTILEIIVSTSIFVIIMLIVVGALISLNNESKKARSIRVVTDNLSAAIDSMSRNIRMGSYYHCGCGDPITLGDLTYPTLPRDCQMDPLGGGGDQCFAFESQFGNPALTQDQYIYRLSSDHRIERSRDGGANFVALTAPEITVKDMHFYVFGSTPDDDQPFVTLVLRGTASVTPTSATAFNIQTTLGSRTPNFSVATP
jgi:type II secretory pathway pseudopilin PulG